jgi:hypothetical protein
MFESYPAELRPVLTSHRLRRRRHRGAASLLTGAALALGFTALRPAPAGAAAATHAATAGPKTSADPRPPYAPPPPTRSAPTRSAPAPPPAS